MTNSTNDPAIQQVLDQERKNVIHLTYGEEPKEIKYDATSHGFSILFEHHQPVKLSGAEYQNLRATVMKAHRDCLKEFKMLRVQQKEKSLLWSSGPSEKEQKDIDQLKNSLSNKGADKVSNTPATMLAFQAVLSQKASTELSEKQDKWLVRLLNRLSEILNKAGLLKKEVEPSFLNKSQPPAK